MGATATREAMKIVPPGKKKCVWMEAGVVSYKLCDNNYDCSTCVYDQAMQAKAARHREAVMVTPPEQGAEQFPQSWVEMKMQLPASQRKCRYMITGEIDRKLCANAYDCGTCSFDQMMQERLQSETLPVPVRTEAGGFELAEDFYYHDGHTWARPEYGGRVRVGLDDFARKLLGRLSRVELPNVGHPVAQGEAAFLVRRNGDMARVLAPVDGIVAHVNYELIQNPDLIQESPYEKGWLFIVEPTKLKKNLKALHYGEQARSFTLAEKDQLFEMADEELRLAADGGVPMEDIAAQLKDRSWSKVVSTFLRT